jgi:hypothetical protein
MIMGKPYREPDNRQNENPEEETPPSVYLFGILCFRPVRHIFIPALDSHSPLANQSIIHQ